MDLDKTLNTILHADCMDIMKDIPDGFFDLTITSPPYNMRTRICNGKYTVREKTEHFSKKYKNFHDAYPIDVFYNFHRNVLIELLRISKMICYNIQIVTGSKEAFFKIIGDFSANIKDIIIWDKGHGEPAIHEKVLNSCYELILVLENDYLCGRVIQNAKFLRGRQDNILRIQRERSSDNKHKAVFPKKLVSKLLTLFSNEHDIVFDPFSGSGTTVCTCHILNRNFLAIEKDYDYWLASCKRLEELRAQGLLFK